MKSFISSLLIALLFVCLTLSCEEKNTPVADTLQTQSSQAKLSGSDILTMPMDSINYDYIGKFVYQHMKNHMNTFDHYQLIPKEYRELLRAKYDSLKSVKQPNNGEHWDQALSAKKISKELNQMLKSLDKEMKQNLANSSSKDDVESWFKRKIDETKKSAKYSIKDKHFSVKYLTILQFTFRAVYEAYPQPVAKTGRIAGESCLGQNLNCAAGYIATYAGIGSVFGPDGGAAGAIIGAFVSMISCHCDNNFCSYARYVSTPDVCYNQYNGLTIRVGDYGTTGTGYAEGFVYKIYKDFNLIAANQLAEHIETNNFTVFSEQELQGYRSIYVTVATNCSGTLQYQPATTPININTLGTPQFYMTGSSSPTINSYVNYDLIGRNLQNVDWNIWTYGPTNGTFIYKYPYQAQVLWNSTPGFVHITANASTACGSGNSGVYVTTHN